jgi:hypothetical protein
VGLLNERVAEMGKGGGVWIGSIWLKTAKMAGIFEHVKEQWGYVKFGKYVDWLRNC